VFLGNGVSAFSGRQISSTVLRAEKQLLQIQKGEQGAQGASDSAKM